MLKLILIRLEFFYFLIILTFSFSYQNSFANVSDLDRWIYIKSLIEDRIKLSENLISEISTKTDSEESLREKYNLIASLTGENGAHIQGLIQKSGITLDPSSLETLMTIINEIKLHDVVPWVHFPERMEKGVDSFNHPFMQDMLGNLNKTLSELEVLFPKEACSRLVDPLMVLTLYFRVNHQISVIQKITKGLIKPRVESQNVQDRILGVLEEEIVQHNFIFLNTLRRHFFELLDASQRRYLSDLKKSELTSSSVFQSVSTEVITMLRKFETAEGDLRKEFYSLYEKVKFELEIKSRENPDPDLKKLLLFKIDKEQVLKNNDYFKKIFLSIFQKQLRFFDNLISEVFIEFNEKFLEFTKKTSIRQSLISHCSMLAFIIERIQIDLHNRLKEIRDPVDIGPNIFEIFGLNDIKKQELYDFNDYVRSKVIPYYFLFIDKSKSLEKEVDSLILQMRDLRSIIKKSSSKSMRRVPFIRKEELNSLLEVKEETILLEDSKDSETHLTVGDIEHVLVKESSTTIGLKELSIITEVIDSQGGEALESKFSELAESPTDIESLERGATIFVQPIEDEYTAYIQNRIKGRHLEVLESIYSPQLPSIRFETLQSLIERCGGMLRFDGRGSSHFHITLPGGHTGRSWRLHGGAHSSKIQHRALEGFRDAFSGVAKILGIEHALQR